MKTVEEDISPEHRAVSQHSESKNPFNTRGSQKINQFSLMNSPGKNFSPKRKMFDLYNIRNFHECTVGDLFGFKNRLFLKIVFRAVIQNVFFTQIEKKMLRRQHKAAGFIENKRQGGSFAGEIGGGKLSIGLASLDSNKSDEDESDDDDEEEEFFSDTEKDKPPPKRPFVTTAINSVRVPGAMNRNSEHNLHHKSKLFIPAIPVGSSGTRLTAKFSDGGGNQMQTLMLPKNQSENDVQSMNDFKDYENFILDNVTFGITIVNSDIFMPHFLKLMNDLYSKHIEKLA